MEGQLVEGQTQIVSTGSEPEYVDPPPKKWWDKPVIVMGLLAVFVMLLVGLIIALRVV